MSFIQELIKTTENKFASIAESGITAGDITNYIDSGSYSLNALLSGSIFGGFPSNKIVVISSEPSCGKTFLAIGAAKSFLQQYKNGIVVLFETESALSKEMLKQRGIDTSRFAVIPVVTVQEFRTQALRIIDKYETEKESERVPLFFILDSLGMLSTDKELSDSLSGEDKQDMTRAKLIKGAFRMLTLRLGRAQIPLVVTNHVYANINGGLYGQPIPSGGTGSIYSSSIALSLTKAKEKDTSTNEVTGAIVTVTATKSRVTREHTKIKCLIRFDGGLDRHYGLLELAETAGIFKKVSTRYELPDGSKQFGKAINENPEKFFTQDVLDQINEYIKDNFLYLSTDVPEKIKDNQEDIID